MCRGKSLGRRPAPLFGTIWENKKPRSDYLGSPFTENVLFENRIQRLISANHPENKSEFLSGPCFGPRPVSPRSSPYIVRPCRTTESVCPVSSSSYRQSRRRRDDDARHRHHRRPRPSLSTCTVLVSLLGHFGNAAGDLLGSFKARLWQSWEV